MADLPTRRQHESELQRTIADVLERNRAEWERGLAAPKTEREIREEVEAILLLLFIGGSDIAAGELRIGVSSQGAGTSWARSMGGSIARLVVNRVAQRVQKLRAQPPTIPTPPPLPVRPGFAGTSTIPEIDYEALNKLLDEIASMERWEALAATEATRAITAGGEFAANVFRAMHGEPALAIWHTSQKYPDRVCPVCRPLNGRPRDEWEPLFPLGPPVHAMCRCFVDYESSTTEAMESFPDHRGRPGQRGGSLPRGSAPAGKAQTKTAAFKKWFGDSKVVDENGEPLVVYHGTGADFTAYDPATRGRGGAAAGLGFYFSENPKTASDFAEMQNGSVQPVYLRIERPLDFESLLSAKHISEAWPAAAQRAGIEMNAGYFAEKLTARAGKDGTVTGWAAWKSLQQSASNPKEINDVVAAVGYDGMLHGSRDPMGTPREGWERDNYGEVWIAFSPTQIKSATGNRGTFDPKKPDIREGR